MVFWRASKARKEQEAPSIPTLMSDGSADRAVLREEKGWREKLSMLRELKKVWALSS